MIHDNTGFLVSGAGQLTVRLGAAHGYGFSMIFLADQGYFALPYNGRGFKHPT